MSPLSAPSTSARVLVNPHARDGVRDELQLAVDRTLGDQAEVIETTSPEATRAAVLQASEEGQVVVAAGGDGTVHAVVNALMACPHPAPLGIVPLGTSNNFCRNLGLPLEVDDALRVVRNGVAAPTDLVRMTVDGEQRYYATIATTGNAERVIDGLGDEDKQRWGAWCYLRAALPVLADLQGYDVGVRFDGGAAEPYRLWNLIVANGRYAGGGLDVAPEASLTDGLLDVVLIAEGEGVDLAGLASDFLLSNYLEHERVTYRQVESFYVESDRGLRFLADGEALEGHSFGFEALRDALRVITPRG